MIDADSAHTVLQLSPAGTLRYFLVVGWGRSVHGSYVATLLPVGSCTTARVCRHPGPLRETCGHFGGVS